MVVVHNNEVDYLIGDYLQDQHLQGAMTNIIHTFLTQTVFIKHSTFITSSKSLKNLKT